MPHPFVGYVPNQLADKLMCAENETILYCDYYYFVLEIDDYIEFWLHGNHFLGKMAKQDLPSNVIDYLENNCPKFINFYKNRQYNDDLTIKWKENFYYHQNIPNIGNAYSAMVYKIVTEKDNDRNLRIIHLHEDYGGGGWSEFVNISEREVEAFLTLTIFSKTHKTIKSIYELDCFKSSI
jgi:hypothetical protein